LQTRNTAKQEYHYLKQQK